jgi:hypothetical protein
VCPFVETLVLAKFLCYQQAGLTSSLPQKDRMRWRLLAKFRSLAAAKLFPHRIANTPGRFDKMRHLRSDRPVLPLLEKLPSVLSCEGGFEVDLHQVFEFSAKGAVKRRATLR